MVEAGMEGVCRRQRRLSVAVTCLGCGLEVEEPPTTASVDTVTFSN
jgi:hypothetical protein